MYHRSSEHSDIMAQITFKKLQSFGMLSGRSGASSLSTILSYTSLVVVPWNGKYPVAILERVTPAAKRSTCGCNRIAELSGLRKPAKPYHKMTLKMGRLLHLMA